MGKHPFRHICVLNLGMLAALTGLSLWLFLSRPFDSGRHMSSPRVSTELSQVRTTFVCVHRWLCSENIPPCNPSASDLVREITLVLS